MRRALWIGSLCVGLAGCYSGYAADTVGEVAGDTEGPGGDAGDGPGGSSGPGDDGGGDDGGEVPTDSQCAWEDGLPRLPMRRLTRLEYNNTVRDLFGITSEPALAFIDDNPAGGYHANDLAVGALQVRLYVSVAETVAAEVVTSTPGLRDCDLGEDACVQGFVQTWGRRVFRRDLTADEVDDYVAYFAQRRDEAGVDAALEHTLAAWLASPHFLYLARRDGADEPHADAYAQAARLAYFLWSSTPDEALLDRAAAGELEELDQLEGVVREMLEDPRAESTLQTFATQWLHLGTLAQGAGGKDAQLYPIWDEDLARSMDAEIQALFADVVLDGEGTVAELLQTRRAYVDAPLAEVYGVEAPTEDWGWVELPADERAGILTRAGFNAALAHQREGSIVLRGVALQTQLLCNTFPNPPDGAVDMVDVDTLDNPQCAGCHTMINPLCDGLREYDAIGQWNDVPSEGTLVGAGDTPFEGGVELSDLLAQSETVQRCIARQWFQFSHRRAIEDADACVLDLVEQAVVDSGGDIREAMVAVATSDSFRFGIDS